MHPSSRYSLHSRHHMNRRTRIGVPDLTHAADVICAALLVRIGGAQVVNREQSLIGMLMSLKDKIHTSFVEDLFEPYSYFTFVFGAVVAVTVAAVHGAVGKGDNPWPRMAGRVCSCQIALQPILHTGDGGRDGLEIHLRGVRHKMHRSLIPTEPHVHAQVHICTVGGTRSHTAWHCEPIPVVSKVFLQILSFILLNLVIAWAETTLSMLWVPGVADAQVTAYNSPAVPANESRT